MSLTVEPLALANLGAASGVLARAFRDNPGILVLFRGDDPETRLRLLEPCMRGFTEAVLRFGFAEVVRDGDDVVAVALCFGPGRFPPPFRSQFTMAKGPIRAGLARAWRFARIDQEMRRRHPHYRHWYLWFLGVEPKRQGQGLGSMLLSALSERAAKDGVACYLETDKQSSVRLYERHGYAVESEEILKGIDLKMWFMRRPAR
jgi:ribosomal protein S18 acetylase RimI-like enzyme